VNSEGCNATSDIPRNAWLERLLFYLQGENPGTLMGVMMGPRASWFSKQKYLAQAGYQTSVIQSIIYSVDQATLAPCES